MCKTKNGNNINKEYDYDHNSIIATLTVITIMSNKRNNLVIRKKEGKIKEY